MSSERIQYASPRFKERKFPFLWTTVFAVLGCVAVGLWVATFEREGGSNGGSYLFPISVLIDHVLYRSQSIPVPVWYGSAFGQWVIVGCVIDLARLWVRRRRKLGPVDPDA